VKPLRVLVVDDSAFFRRRIGEILATDPLLELAGTAANGQEAIERTVELKPDVITMDVEMPVLDGISAVRRIMARQPTPILMFSSLTHEAAQATLDALEAGALDFLPKRLEDIAHNTEEAGRLLCARLRALGRRVLAARPALGQERSAAAALAPALRHRYRLVAIGTSTGGPTALQQVLTELPADFPAPLLLIQHMPASFTPAFAARLNQRCAIAVHEAQDGDALKPGEALLAPGGRQMVLERHNGTARVRIQDSRPDQPYRPCVDLTFASAASAFPAQVLAVVMTGMGADGREGARALKQGGSTIWAQDENSCVVYGMPMAVIEAGLADQVLPLARIGHTLAREV
jgi:two-component system chemotaxis response regulator CheB